MNIQIVDDSIFVRTVLTKLIDQHFPDATIITSNDGIEAYEKYAQIHPDLVITDLLMPKMNGYEFVLKIKQLNPTAKVIVLTADIQNMTKQELQNTGILGYISKPLTSEKSDELIELIRGQIHAE